MADPSQSGSACEHCRGEGYVVDGHVGSAARARRCSCQTRCRRCGETGYTLVPTGTSSVAQICTCRHLEERVALFNALGIPAALARASFESYRALHPGQGSAKQLAEEFARKFRLDQPTRGLLFCGNPGCGKTHLLVAILRYLALEKGVPGRYVEFMLLLSDIRAGFNSNRGHMEILGPLAVMPLLAIDELGKERGTEWERSMLDELISRRYNAGLTTLFATNYPRDPQPVPTQPGRMVRTTSPEFQREAETMSLEERVGQRIFSRLSEMYTIVRVDGPDSRKVNEPGRDSYWRGE
jgi:DNA replication protein DnaC